MEASVRLFISTRHLDRRLPLSIKTRIQHPLPLKLSNPDLSTHSASLSASRSSNVLPFVLSLTLSRVLSSPSDSHFNRFDRSSVDPKHQHHISGNSPVEVDARGRGLGSLGDRGEDLTVVLLGWLGAEKRHLKRYAGLYTTRGIRAVEFVVPVSDFMGLDLGRRVEGRIMALAEELIEWLSETEKDGKDRGLLFHTFSNTGWLAYGAILDNFQQKGDFMKRIKGCVVDSGGDPEINPQVWAAGFSSALLKKRNSSAVSSVDTGGGSPSKEGFLGMQDTITSLIETLILSILEKFFSHVLELPVVNRRLSKVISILFNNQPYCPQLYLYSTADRVIPVRSIEYFIEEQKKSGRQVRAHNFGSSPHVDHFRSFPHIYSEKLYQFLDFCILKVCQT